MANTMLLDSQDNEYIRTVLLQEDCTEILDNDIDLKNVPTLHLVGDKNLPDKIQIIIDVGQSFTIGRFDVSVGYKQSNFEFDKRTVAVSRHHAVITRTLSGYLIKDLGSKAGTYVNGLKIPANVDVKLENNSNVSFGNAGANYLWNI